MYTVIFTSKEQVIIRVYNMPFIPVEGHIIFHVDGNYKVVRIMYDPFKIQGGDLKICCEIIKIN